MKSLTIVFLVFISVHNFAQTDSIIEYAIQLGEEWKFEQAIDVLKEEIKQNPDHAEAYYWLGRYSHYIVYDTRPFENKSDEWSKDEVLKNLQKAVDLKPDYGDAKYFLAAEHGARALEALKQNNVKQYKKEFQDAFNAGGFPSHILEYCRNILKSCDENAILIVQGDMQFNTIQYLQNIEGFRKDVSLVVWALLERPYYIGLIRDGVDGVFKPVPITMTDNLIMEMHNYKWRTNNISISLSDEVKSKYQIADSIHEFVWTVEPDVGEKKLWVGTAIFINIMETNKFLRPVYFSFESIAEDAGLSDFIQISGMISQIIPFKINEEYYFDIESFERLMLDSENFVNYSNVREDIQPRVSPLACLYPRNRLIEYAYYLEDQGQNEKAKVILDFMLKTMPPDYYPISESMQKAIDKLNQRL